MGIVNPSHHNLARPSLHALLIRITLFSPSKSGMILATES